MGIVKMRNLVCLCLLVAAGCSVAQAKVPAGETAAAHAHAFALLHRTAVVNPAPAPTLKCDGSGVIRHGDGHTTPCPGCDNCKKAEPLIKPAVLKTVRRVKQDLPTVVTLQGDCATCTANGGTCECTTAGACADGSCGTVTATAGSCASGSCGAASGGPIRNAIKARPIRGLVGKIRERKPVRKLLGRLFRRR